MTFFHTDVVFSDELVVTRLLCGMRTRPAVAGMTQNPLAQRNFHGSLASPSK